MRACFINPPWVEGDRSGIRAGCRFPNLTVKNTNSYVPFPFLLAYAASYSESLGVEVLLIDGVAERCGVESVVQRIQNFAPDLIVSESSSTSLAYDLGVLAQIRAHNPGARIAIYGPHVTVRPEEALAGPAVDFVIHGEPEIPAFELVRALSKGSDPTGIPGLSHRGDEGAIQINSRQTLIDDLDELPYPMRDGLPMNGGYSVPGFPSPVMFMYGSRGCPYKCTFCLWPQTMLEDKFRTRSAEGIAREMAWVLEKYPATRSFFFDDDTFNLGRPRMIRFADELDRLGLKVPWGMNARADNWDRELMERLVATGLFTLRIGVESGDQAVLDRTRKGITLTQVRETLEMSRELGILNHVSFIIGLPGETEETVANTIRFIKSVPVDSVQFSVATPFPGTEFHRYAEEHGFIVNRDLSTYNGFDQVVVRTEAMSAEEISKAITRARRKVYFSPRFIKHRLSYVRDLRDLGALARKVWRLVSSSA